MGEPMAFQSTFIANTCASELTRRTNRKVSSLNPSAGHNAASQPTFAVVHHAVFSVAGAHGARSVQLAQRDLPDVRAHAGFVPDGVCMDAERIVKRTASPPAIRLASNRQVGTVKECVGTTRLTHPEPGGLTASVMRSCHFFGVGRP